MASSYVRVKVSGPIFDGRAQVAADQWVKNTELALARQGAAIIRDKSAKFNRSGRGGTGGASRSVSYRNEGGSWYIQGDSAKGKVWWPWLEGTSRRNQTTRFKGYHVFRLARAVIAKRWRKLAQDELDRYIGQMGGR